VRIKHIKIHNYRSIRELEFECSPFVTLIGPNNHGKSNILSAIEFGLTTSAKPAPEDFFAYRDGESTLWVEVTFHELTVEEERTFHKYMRSDGTICIRKTAQQKGERISVAYNGYIEQPEETWLRSGNVGEYTNREKINSTPLRDLVPQKGRLTKAHVEEAQRQFIAMHRENLRFHKVLESAPLLGQTNVAGGVLPDFYLIPAVKDLTDELKVRSTTTFGRLLTRTIREMATREPRFREIQHQLEEVVQSLNARDDRNGRSQLALLESLIEGELETWGVTVQIQVAPPDLGKIFEIGTNVYLNDGVETEANQKGHGLQRATIFALLRAWAKILQNEKLSEETGTRRSSRKRSDSIVFAMEEPEIFLHPHAQRRLKTALREIAETPQHQVFITTHSTHFVDMEHYEEIVMVTKPSAQEGSRVRQYREDLFPGEDANDRKKRFHMAQWINPERGEMFFARKVIFVEGETEKVILPFIAHKLDVFDPEVSIIDCGAKHNLPLYITIANAFQIPYLVIHDEDPLPATIPEEWSSEKREARKRTFNLNRTIQNMVDTHVGETVIFSPDFEGANKIPKTQGKKKGKALAALDYFHDKEVEEIPSQLQEVVRKAYGRK